MSSEDLKDYEQYFDPLSSYDSQRFALLDIQLRHTRLLRKAGILKIAFGRLPEAAQDAIASTMLQRTVVYERPERHPRTKLVISSHVGIRFTSIHTPAQIASPLHRYQRVAMFVPGDRLTPDNDFSYDDVDIIWALATELKVRRDEGDLPNLSADLTEIERVDNYRD